MPSLERQEIPGNPGSYPKGEGFTKLLNWHLNFGTRPDGKPDQPGKRWNNKGFAAAVGVESDRTVRNWRRGVGKRLNDYPSVEAALFGSNPVFNAWRAELRAAYDAGNKTNDHSAATIPLPPALFLGRDNDVKSILDVLLGEESTPAILVQGGPGIGKSSLTRVIGNHPDVIERYGEPHRWFVELDTATTAIAMQDAIARAIGVDPAHGFTATLAALRARPGLLVLDNLETPWDPTDERQKTEANLAALANIRGLAVLASFRGRDRIAGVSWALVHPVERLEAPFDTELFQRVAQTSFESDPCLPGFITALDGIPLAIELVAARAYGRASLAALWDEWNRIGLELAAHPDFDAGRLTSLPHSIELSLKSSRLTEVAFRLFRFLGQLPAGLVAEDREALLGDGGLKAEEALLRIGLAIERMERLDLLSPIRDHALRHHEPVGTDKEAWPTHFLALTKRLGEAIGTREGEGAIPRLAPELPNIEAAFRAALKAGRRQDAMGALTGFRRMTYIGSLPTPVLAEVANACRSDGDILGEANCIKSLGNIALARSDHDAARKAFEQTLPLYRQVGDILGEANCIRSLGDIALRRSDHDAARKAYEEALALFRTAGGILGQANCIQSLGDIALRRSDHDAARKAYEEALPLYRQVGDVHGEANCIMSLGDIALARSDHEAARKAYEGALSLYQKIGNIQGEANCIEAMKRLPPTSRPDV